MILDQTHVLGNFATFCRMEHLQLLGLEGCNITGNITGTLYTEHVILGRLRILRLGWTGVTGELSDLVSLSSLQELYAAGTAITGDIKLLMGMADIRVVDLSGTNVSGRIISKWVGKVQKLRSLDVSETRLWSQHFSSFSSFDFWCCHIVAIPFLFDSSLFQANQSKVTPESLGLNPPIRIRKVVSPFCLANPTCSELKCEPSRSCFQPWKPCRSLGAFNTVVFSQRVTSRRAAHKTLLEALVVSFSLLFPFRSW